MFRSTGRETSFSTERCKTVVQSVVPQMHIHDMGPSIAFMKPWALTICMENQKIPGRIQRERFTLVDVFRKKSNTFRGITFLPFLPKRLKFSVPFVWITTASLQVERKRKIYRYFVNGTTQSRSCFLCQKKYQHHLTEIFHRNFRKNGKRSKFCENGKRKRKTDKAREIFSRQRKTFADPDFSFSGLCPFYQ